ncbi:Glutathione S-transferase E14 [Pseudolycoriella hygida]|uniref:glutathione transferase n=1 Tax=Pseudolycoriella hygida TaxID=35572 RepID=A0A9Q0MTK8_9DIPT|nr:Glutathione S-transferase E14 [Pseudolycoriella hygida]
MLLVSIRSFVRKHNRLLSFDYTNMKPILFYDDISPVVRSVLMLIDELEIDVEMKHIDLFTGDQRSLEYFNISPNRTVPALKHNDLVITDSHVILIYLVEEFGGQSTLYPSDKVTRIKVLDLLFFNGTNLFRKDSDLLSEIIAKSVTDMARHTTKVQECYESLETFLSNSDFLAGNFITIADFSVVATLSTVNLVQPVNDNQFPKLAKWFQNMKQRPSYVSGNVPGLQKLRAILADRSDFPIFS